MKMPMREKLVVQGFIMELKGAMTLNKSKAMQVSIQVRQAIFSLTQSYGWRSFCQEKTVRRIKLSNSFTFDLSLEDRTFHDDFLFHLRLCDYEIVFYSFMQLCDLYFLPFLFVRCYPLLLCFAPLPLEFAGSLWIQIYSFVQYQ